MPTILLLAYEGRVYVKQHNRLFDIKSLAQRLAARAAPTDQLTTFRSQNLALQFYAGRPVARTSTPAELQSLASDGRAVYVVAEERSWPDLANTRPWRVVDETRIAGRRMLVGTTAVRP